MNLDSIYLLVLWYILGVWDQYSAIEDIYCFATANMKQNSQKDHGHSSQENEENQYFEEKQFHSMPLPNGVCAVGDVSGNVKIFRYPCIASNALETAARYTFLNIISPSKQYRLTRHCGWLFLSAGIITLRRPKWPFPLICSDRFTPLSSVSVPTKVACSRLAMMIEILFNSTRHKAETNDSGGQRGGYRLERSLSGQLRLLLRIGSLTVV